MFKITLATKFKITKFVNKILLPFLVYFSLMVVFAIVVYSVLYTSLKQEELLKIFIGSFTTLSILLAYKQFTMNSDFTKRHLALESIRTISETNKEHRDELNKLMDYANTFKQASLNSTSISRTDMKELLFQKDNDMNFIGIGSKESPHILTTDGRLILTHIIEILNNFEMMAVGIIHNVYDEIVMKDYFEEIVKKNYIVYKDFLIYLRSDAHLNDKAFCENYEWLVNHWEEKPKKIMR